MKIHESKYAYEDLSDGELLIKLRDSNKYAFEELYNRYWRRLSDYALQKTKSIDTTKEIIQELFINIWERRYDIAIQNIETYLFSSVKYKVIYELRKNAKQVLTTTTIDESNLQYTDNHSTEITDLNKLIDQCLSELPPKTQEIFLKSRREELSHKEISSLFDISEKSVEYHISQAIKALRVGLKDFLPTIFILSKHFFE